MSTNRGSSRQSNIPFSSQYGTRRGGRDWLNQPRKVAPSPDLSSGQPKLPTGELVQILVPGQSDATKRPDKEKPVIAHCKYVASFNWLDTKQAKILVPGSPPTWLPPARSVRLKEDNGIYFRDQNAHRYPSYPLEPSIRAVFAVQPNFECVGIDIVGCGHTFGSLLSACRVVDERTFTFGVERIGTTTFLVRLTAPMEVVDNVRGYGHSFPEAYTSWPKDVKGSVSHQRLVEYRFGHLQCLIRSESDGYIPSKISAEEMPDGFHVPTIGDDNLEYAAKALMVSETMPTTRSKLSVQHAGQTVPQSAIFDLKTRSARKNIELEEFLPRLWVNQTPNFILARHTSGKFEEVEIHDVRSALRDWETTNTATLLRLQDVLDRLIGITAKEGSSRIQVCRNGLGPLEIRKPTEDWTCLPTDLKAKWTGKPLAEGEKNALGDSGSDDEDDEDYLKF